MRTDRLSSPEAITPLPEARTEPRPFLARVAERPGVTLAIIVLLGTLLRLALLAVAWSHPERFIQPDSFGYLAIGQDFSNAVIHGRGPSFAFSVYRPPGYPAFIALIHAVSPSIRLLVLVQIALAALTTVLVYRVTMRLFGQG